MRNQLQSKLFEEILGKFPKKSAAVLTLSKLLGTGKDAIYRRFRGDTLLTPDEIALLCKEFKISLDSLVYEKTDSVVFNFNPFFQDVYNFKDFLLPIFNDLSAIAKLPDTSVYYASSEIPLFYYCFFPELIAFKFYIWGRTVWDFEYLRKTPFDLDLIPFPIIRLSEELLNLYKNIPSTALWDINFMDNTLNQVEYHVRTQNFKNPQDAVLICDKLKALSKHMRNMAEHGKKYLVNGVPETGGALQLFHNEMIFTSNTILVNSSAGNAVYQVFTNPNFMKSTDQKLCTFTKNWFSKLTSKCNNISVNSEKNRDIFFNSIDAKIDTVKSRVSAQIKVGH